MSIRAGSGLETETEQSRVIRVIYPETTVTGSAGGSGQPGRAQMDLLRMLLVLASLPECELTDPDGECTGWAWVEI